jgi:hypothetical protein
MAVAVTALVVALGGVAVAAPIGGDGKVHLCYSQQAIDNPASSEGDLVVATNAGTACPDDFPDELVFSQAGPEGKVGPVGAPGTPGTPGPQGVPGGEKLPKPISKDLIDDLKKADKLAEKNREKLSEIDDKIARMKREAERVRMEALLRQQQHVIESVKEIASAVSRMAEANRRVVQGLD